MTTQSTDGDTVELLVENENLRAYIQDLEDQAKEREEHFVFVLQAEVDKRNALLSKAHQALKELQGNLEGQKKINASLRAQIDDTHIPRISELTTELEKAQAARAADVQALTDAQRQLEQEKARRDDLAATHQRTLSLLEREKARVGEGDAVVPEAELAVLRRVCMGLTQIARLAGEEISESAPPLALAELLPTVHAKVLEMTEVAAQMKRVARVEEANMLLIKELQHKREQFARAVAQRDSALARLDAALRKQLSDRDRLFDARRGVERTPDVSRGRFRQTDATPPDARISVDGPGSPGAVIHVHDED